MQNRDMKNAKTQTQGPQGSPISQSEWEIGSLKLHPEVVWSIAMSSLRLRITRSTLTVLTIATATAFMMYLMTMAGGANVDPETAATEHQSWILMMVLALVVSAAGVLNTMLMNVTQRYREIGTMKCLGALDSFILLSVLLEAAALGLVGAVVGVVLGLIIASLLALADFGAAFLAHMAISGLAFKILFVFLVGMVLTTFGAAIPAFIASRMPPMDAMRGEK
jgi:ABC-type antimicrobial peptide transport system permease subunit